MHPARARENPRPAFRHASGSADCAAPSGPPTLILTLVEGIKATPRQYLLYLGLYLAWGLIMNAIGKRMHVAEFKHWWQVITCYDLYLVPISLLLRRKSAVDQYVYGVLALAPIELAGYAIGSSLAYPGNFIDGILGPRNFTLAMSVFFGLIPPVGNAVVRWLDRLSAPRVAPDATG